MREIIKVKFWDHAHYSNIDLEKSENRQLGGVLTVVYGLKIAEDEQRILIASWLAPEDNSEVYAILKNDIIEVERLIPESEVRKMLRKRRKKK